MASRGVITRSKAKGTNSKDPANNKKAEAAKQPANAPAQSNIPAAVLEGLIKRLAATATTDEDKAAYEQWTTLLENNKAAAAAPSNNPPPENGNIPDEKLPPLLRDGSYDEYRNSDSDSDYVSGYGSEDTDSESETEEYKWKYPKNKLPLSRLVPTIYSYYDMDSEIDPNFKINNDCFPDHLWTAWLGGSSYNLCNTPHPSI